MPRSNRNISGSILPRADTKKNTPAITNVRFLPRLDARKPDIAEPMMHPIKALDEVNPW